MFTTPQPPVSFDTPTSRKGILVAIIAIWTPIAATIAQVVVG